MRDSGIKQAVHKSNHFLPESCSMELSAFNSKKKIKMELSIFNSILIFRMGNSIIMLWNDKDGGVL